jgi:hypothetical protein
LPAISSSWWWGTAAAGGSWNCNTAARSRGGMLPTDDRGGVQAPPAVWPRAVDRALSPRRPKIDDLGEGKRWWCGVVGPTS